MGILVKRAFPPEELVNTFHVERRVLLFKLYALTRV